MSRYLATVRRASFTPFSDTIIAMASSLSGLPAGSPAIIAWIMFRTAAAALASPSSVTSETLNSDFNG